MNQQQAQKIFDVLVEKLKSIVTSSFQLLAEVYEPACRDNLVTDLKSISNHSFFQSANKKLQTDSTDYKINSLQSVFSKAVRNSLDIEGIEGIEGITDEFLAQVYEAAFHTVNIPKNRNHINMTFVYKSMSQQTSELNLWIDMDKIAANLNNHFKIDPHYRFEITHHAQPERKTYGFYDTLRIFLTWDRLSLASLARNESLIDDNTTNVMYSRFEVNSLKNPSYIDTYFLLGCIWSAIVSVYALLIAALAVASIISLSTAGIFTAVGVGLVAGGASYCFFKAIPGVTTTVAAIAALEHEKIEDIFEKNFAEKIPLTILDEDSNEIIYDTQALLSLGVVSGSLY